MKYLTLFPLIEMESRLTESLPLMVILTFLRWVFIDMSTPATLPVTLVPFFSSIVTCS